MPSFEHVVQTPFHDSFRTRKIAGMFDMPAGEGLKQSWTVDLPIEEMDWEIGLIVGPSGAGKTTIAKRAFGEDAYHDGYVWSPDKAIVDDFPAHVSPKAITEALSASGLGSAPAWLKPYHVLSNGQKFRAEVARLLYDPREIVVMDEFTSVVDRNVARNGSAAVAKFVRKSKRKFVAVSCHYDIIDWLAPDWVYQVDTNTFTRGSLRRPPIEVTIQRVHHSAWHIFKGHHYLNAGINKAAQCFLATIDGNPVAFGAALPMPHALVKNMWRGHRTVVLPDYQGLGLGNLISETIAQYFLDQGKRYTSTSSHPAILHHRSKSPKWVMTRAPSQTPVTGDSGMIKSSAGRMTASFEYIGDGSKYRITRKEKNKKVSNETHTASISNTEGDRRQEP